MASARGQERAVMSKLGPALQISAMESDLCTYCKATTNAQKDLKFYRELCISHQSTPVPYPTKKPAEISAQTGAHTGLSGSGVTVRECVTRLRGVSQLCTVPLGSNQHGEVRQYLQLQKCKLARVNLVCVSVGNMQIYRAIACITSISC